MASLVYDRNGRLLFTKEMAREYTLLVPQMLPIHFSIIVKVLEREGLHVVCLQNDGPNVVNEGLKYVHNDTCYPALLVIGQFMDAIKNGGFDPHKVALFISQTGGGCRASNYIHLLRKALRKTGMEYIPVVSFSAGVEKNPGFRMSFSLMRKIVYTILYGDLLMDLANQIRPYETERGATDRAVTRWEEELAARFDRGKGMSRRAIRGYFDEIISDLAKIPRDMPRTPDKVRVGIVGEIYVKFSAMGNNRLEEFLLSEGVEPVVPGLIDFMIFKLSNRVTDCDLYGGSWWKRFSCGCFKRFMESCQREMIDALKASGVFRAPCGFETLRKLAKDYLGEGCMMGEGWLLTAEMLELIRSGTPNIVCAQPFGCLPNHIVGKGMVRAIKDRHPEANIVAVDYDPSATRINQENRIKLKLAKSDRSHVVL